MTHYSFTAKVVGLASLLLAYSLPADACRPGPTGLTNISSRVPVDGAVVLTFSCPSEQETCTADDLPAFSVRDATLLDAEVPGRLVRKELLTGSSATHWAVWRPDTPFIAGHVYTLTATGVVEPPSSLNIVATTFEAVAVDGFDPRSVQPSLELSVYDGPSGPETCCPTALLLRGCAHGPEFCFRAEHAQRVNLSVTGVELPRSLQQWLFRSTYRVGDQTTTLPESPYHVSNWSGDLATEHCFSLDAIHVVTGEVVKLGAECKQLPAMPPERRPATENELYRSLQHCAVTPPEYEALWRKYTRGSATQSDGGMADALSADAAVDLNASVSSDDGGCRLGDRSSGPSFLASVLLLSLYGRRRRLGKR